MTEVTYYKAEDGTVFSSEFDCFTYERDCCQNSLAYILDNGEVKVYGLAGLEIQIEGEYEIEDLDLAIQKAYYIIFTTESAVKFFNERLGENFELGLNIWNNDLQEWAPIWDIDSAIEEFQEEIKMYKKAKEVIEKGVE